MCWSGCGESEGWKTCAWSFIQYKVPWRKINERWIPLQRLHRVAVAFAVSEKIMSPGKEKGRKNKKQNGKKWKTKNMCLLYTIICWLSFLCYYVKTLFSWLQFNGERLLQRKHLDPANISWILVCQASCWVLSSALSHLLHSLAQFGCGGVSSIIPAREP